LRSTIKHSLGQFNVVPAIDFEQDQNLVTPYSFKHKDVVQPKVQVDSSFNPFVENGGTAVQIPRKKSAKGWEDLYVGLESKVGKELDFSSVRLESETITGSIFENEEEQVNTGNSTFQLHSKYVVTTIRSGMLIIDQGRAHQRILYERFLKYGTLKEAVSQQLLFPLSLRFNRPELEQLSQLKDNLTALGFAFGEIDEKSVQIKGVPVLMGESEVGSILDQLLSDYNEQVGYESFSQTDRLSRSLSKALSIKTGDKLDPDSQLALVNDLFACKETSVSPFNKRIYITVTGNEIANKF